MQCPDGHTRDRLARTSTGLPGSGVRHDQVWRDLFTDRQLAALTTFSDLVAEARERICSDARGGRYAG